MRVPNNGVVIRELEEEELAEQVNPEEVPEEELDEELDDIDPDPNALEDLPEGELSRDMFSREYEDSELLNPIPRFVNATGDIPGHESYSVYSTLGQTQERIFGP